MKRKIGNSSSSGQIGALLSIEIDAMALYRHEYKLEMRKESFDYQGAPSKQSCGVAGDDPEL